MTEPEESPFALPKRLTTQWILVNRIPLPCDDLLEWGRFMEDRSKRIVAQTLIDEDLWVSTVFLGLDHGFCMDPEAAPILFETMAFGALQTHKIGSRIREFRESLDQWRYATWAEAEKGHKEACEMMRKKFEEAGAAVMAAILQDASKG